MNVVEMFSGIGSQAKALKRVASRRNSEVNIKAICEWNIHAFLAYDIIHKNENALLDNKVDRKYMVEFLTKKNISYNGKKPISSSTLNSFTDEFMTKIFNSIMTHNNLVDVRDVKGKDIPDDTDLLTYSFPCQDLSNVGSIHGYNNGIDRGKNTRSGLLWEIERILLEKKSESQKLPTFLLLENVTALNSIRHRNNFEDWQKTLRDLGYFNQIYNLNSLDFGIPQNRKRLIMLSVFHGGDGRQLKCIEEYFKSKDLNKRAYIDSLNIHEKKLSAFLRHSYREECLACQPNNTNSRFKIWEDNSKLIKEDKTIANHCQTITTKQDRNPNSGNIYFDYEGNSKSKFRYLTPRECFILMGFDESDYNKLCEQNFEYKPNRTFFTRDILYKLAGNSIVVNVLEQIFEQVFDIDKILKTNVT